jgi:hypothetical protein
VSGLEDHDAVVGVAAERAVDHSHADRISQGQPDAAAPSHGVAPGAVAHEAVDSTEDADADELVPQRGNAEHRLPRSLAAVVVPINIPSRIPRTRPSLIVTLS